MFKPGKYACEPPLIPPRRKKIDHIGPPTYFLLDQACIQINRAFDGFGCYLVGSVLHRPDWRDVDVRFIMKDEAFIAEFPDAGYKDLSRGGHWEHDPKWTLLTVAISERLRAQTGLPIDFQFQPQTWSSHHYGGSHRHPLGMVFAKGS